MTIFCMSEIIPENPLRETARRALPRVALGCGEPARLAVSRIYGHSLALADADASVRQDVTARHLGPGRVGDSDRERERFRRRGRRAGNHAGAGVERDTR